MTLLAWSLMEFKKTKNTVALIGEAIKLAFLWASWVSGAPTLVGSIILSKWPEKETFPLKLDSLSNEGYSMLKLTLKISYNGVYYSLQRTAQTGSNQNRKRSGRPLCTTEQEDKYIRVSSLRNRSLTGPQLAASLDVRQRKIGKKSVMDRHILVWGVWITQKKICETQNKWKDAGGVPDTSVKHGGGNVMVWGCFGAGKVGDLYKVKGILNKEGYHSILQHCAIPCGQRLIGTNPPTTGQWPEVHLQTTQVSYKYLILYLILLS